MNGLLMGLSMIECLNGYLNSGTTRMVDHILLGL